MIFIGLLQRPFEFTWETGNDEWDAFVSRNLDLFIDALMLYGAHTFRKRYQEIFGTALSVTLLTAIAARFGSDVVGYYLSGIIDPDEGKANWNRFQDRAYDWYGLEDYELFGIGIDSFLPNPVALMGITGESVVMIGDYITPKISHSVDIVTNHATTLVVDYLDTLQDHIFNPRFRHAWSPR